MKTHHIIRSDSSEPWIVTCTEDFLINSLQNSRTGYLQKVSEVYQRERALSTRQAEVEEKLLQYVSSFRIEDNASAISIKPHYKAIVGMLKDLANVQDQVIALREEMGNIVKLRKSVHIAAKHCHNLWSDCVAQLSVISPAYAISLENFIQIATTTGKADVASISLALLVHVLRYVKREHALAWKLLIFKAMSRVKDVTNYESAGTSDDVEWMLLCNSIAPAAFETNPAETLCSSDVWGNLVALSKSGAVAFSRILEAFESSQSISAWETFMASTEPLSHFASIPVIPGCFLTHLRKMILIKVLRPGKLEISLEMSLRQMLLCTDSLRFLPQCRIDRFLTEKSQAMLIFREEGSSAMPMVLRSAIENDARFCSKLQPSSSCPVRPIGREAT